MPGAYKPHHRDKAIAVVCSLLRDADTVMETILQSA